MHVLRCYAISYSWVNFSSVKFSARLVASLYNYIALSGSPSDLFEGWLSSKDGGGVLGEISWQKVAATKTERPLCRHCPLLTKLRSHVQFNSKGWHHSWNSLMQFFLKVLISPWVLNGYKVEETGLIAHSKCLSCWENMLCHKAHVAMFDSFVCKQMSLTHNQSNQSMLLCWIAS